MGYRGPKLDLVFKLDPGDVALETTQEWGKRAHRNVVDRTPIGRPDPFDDARDPGALRRGWKVRTRKTLRGYSAVLTNDVHYAIYVNNGTHPHVIRAKNGKALRFMAGGGVVFARSVNHPGTVGHFMLERGIEATRNELGEAGRIPLRRMMTRWRTHIRITGKFKR
jgi:hypothetical protein